MKFQNCNLIFVKTNRREDEWTSPKQYAPSTFSKLGGIKNQPKHMLPVLKRKMVLLSTKPLFKLTVLLSTKPMFQLTDKKKKQFYAKQTLIIKTGYG